MSYVIVAFIGGLIAICYWWGIQKIMVQTQTQAQENNQVIIQAPSFGNLKSRAIELAEEIMENLYIHGWKEQEQKQYPVIAKIPIDDPEKYTRWVDSRTRYFRTRFLERLIVLRNEFAELHIQDERINNFIKTEIMIADARIQAQKAKQQFIDPHINPMEIEDIAEKLKEFANQLQ